MIKQILLDNRRLFLKVLWCLIGLTILGVLFARPVVPFLLGLYFGIAIAVLNFIEMAITMHRAVLMSSSAAQRFVTIKYFARYGLTAVALLVTFVSPSLSPIGAILGLLVIKGVLYGTYLIQDKRKPKQESSRKEE